MSGGGGRLSAWAGARLQRWSNQGDAELAALLENLQRVDLNLVEEARGLRRLLGLRTWTQAQAAQALGKRLSDLNGVLGILQLPEDFLEGFLNSEIALSRNAMIELTRIPAGPARDELLKLARRHRLTISAIRAARDRASGGTASETPEPRELRQFSELRPLSLKVLGGLRGSIRESVEARRVLGSSERQELAELAREINKLLELSDKAFEP